MQDERQSTTSLLEELLNHEAVLASLIRKEEQSPSFFTEFYLDRYLPEGVQATDRDACRALNHFLYTTIVPALQSHDRGGVIDALTSRINETDTTRTAETGRNPLYAFFLASAGVGLSLGVLLHDFLPPGTEQVVNIIATIILIPAAIYSLDSIANSPGRTNPSGAAASNRRDSCGSDAYSLGRPSPFSDPLYPRRMSYNKWWG
ncbi:hypothetical protein COY95_00660 [Candidatus Woesearchaeota archaeon CG_4_10_14_0_8_um_filter_47_5]|nr:MAG: hypothetical protein COY95_00660 [Candidatus Woesearchaeota archaeon CG_4_10_14_0_8_um_filter_47_5]